MAIGVGRTRALFAPSFLNWTRARLELDALDPALVFVSARLSANESRRRRRTVGIVSPSPPSVRALRVDHNARRGRALDVDARVHRRRLDFARVHDARRSRVAVSRGARVAPCRSTASSTASTRAPSASPLAARLAITATARSSSTRRAAIASVGRASARRPDPPSASRCAPHAQIPPRQRPDPARSGTLPPPDAPPRSPRAIPRARKPPNLTPRPYLVSSQAAWRAPSTSAPRATPRVTRGLAASRPTPRIPPRRRRRASLLFFARPDSSADAHPVAAACVAASPRPSRDCERERECE